LRRRHRSREDAGRAPCSPARTCNLLHRLSPTANLGFAWTPRASGRATGIPDSLDLANVERHQPRAKLAVSFRHGAT
jgi:hypothetical protein